MLVVTCYLMGGLGNQLFQIFTTLGFAIRTNRKTVFPYAKQLTTGKVRNTYWKTFLKALKPMTTKNEKNGYTNQQLGNFPVIFKEENDLRYTEIPDVQHYNEMILFGYFQSPKYFDNEKDKIFSMIGIPEMKENIKREEFFKDVMHDQFGISKDFGVMIGDDMGTTKPMQLTSDMAKVYNRMINYEGDDD